MQRSLPDMASTRFDVLVIGGGITGAAIAWDASLRGLTVGLIEKADFGHGTSAATSKLIHGGLRYLKHGQLGVVRASLRERRIMQTITPHLVYPLPFLIPATGYGTAGPAPLLAAAILYNALSYDRDSVPHADQHVPAARLLDRDAVLRRAPSLRPLHPTGGLFYYDCQMYDAGRHVLAFLRSATDYGAAVANYAAATGLLTSQDAVRGVVARDAQTGARYPLTAPVVVNATGPWADGVLQQFGLPRATHLQRSKGIHILTRAIDPPNQALGLRTPNGRHLFILPWQGHALIGTTDVPFEGSPDEPLVTRQDVVQFIATVNATYPPADLSADDIEHAYGGLRPIAATQPGQSTYGASRRYEVDDHARDGRAGLFTVVGGKYTTARALAETLVDRVLTYLQRPPIACSTRGTPLVSGATGAFPAFLHRMRSQYPDVPAVVRHHLSRCYGQRLPDVMALVDVDPSLAEPIVPGRPDIWAQVEYAMDAEMARRLADVVHRRTGLGGVGPVAEDVLHAIAHRMADRLGWSDARIADEIAHTQSTFAWAPCRRPLRPTSL